MSRVAALVALLAFLVFVGESCQTPRELTSGNEKEGISIATGTTEGGGTSERIVSDKHRMYFNFNSEGKAESALIEVGGIRIVINLGGSGKVRSYRLLEEGRYRIDPNLDENGNLLSRREEMKLGVIVYAIGDDGEITMKKE
jgi:hypothetical protein